MQEKYCGGCKQTLPIKSFNKNRTRKDGLQTQCAICICTQAKKTRRSDKRMAYDRAYKERIRNEPELKAHVLEVNRKRNNKRYRTDIEYRLRRIVRTHIKDALTENYTPGIFKHLGYTPTQLKEHLEAQFDHRMSWDNHGQYGWHIDHIVPQSSLPFTDYTDPNFLKCWSLNNLQPLWWDDNLKKSDSLVY